jgi:hypothetical protein
MRRIILLIMVALLMVTMAAPALAQQVEPVQPPPNCEHGQDQGDKDVQVSGGADTVR